ncbi:MAG: hypothetical protein EBU51_08705, partial [Synechococcaceae bacterium WB6_3A_227]|nr:hypothetical protein [Synechococcaceae bacterium WB6_3A_227]
KKLQSACSTAFYQAWAWGVFWGYGDKKALFHRLVSLGKNRSRISSVLSPGFAQVFASCSPDRSWVGWV